MPNAPIQGQIRGSEKYQVNGRSSDGEYYLYEKSTIARKYWQLVYDCVTKSKRDEMLTFFEEHAEATRNYVTWEDHLNDIKTVNFRESSISWQKDSPNEYSITFIVEEIQ